MKTNNVYFTFKLKVLISSIGLLFVSVICGTAAFAAPALVVDNFTDPSTWSPNQASPTPA
jgi:hypothetical protein